MTTETLDPKTLREHAEVKLTTATSPCSIDAMFPPCEEHNFDKVLHELRVHEIELEMQNENLRQAYTDLEESQQHYINLYEFAPVGYLELSKEGIIKNINLAGATLLTTDRSQLLKHLFSQFVETIDRDRFQIFFWNLIRFDTHKTLELSIKTKLNQPFYAQLEGERVKNNENGEFSVRLMLTNITERKQLENLKISVDRYQLATTASGDAIWDWDFATERNYYSERCSKILGNWVRGANNSFKQWEASLHPDDREQTLLQLRRHLEEHVPFIAEYRVLDRDNQTRWVLSTGQAVWDEQGQPLRMAGTVCDITERKVVIQMLLEARELAESADRLKSEFLANMSHEIRTPLHGILGMTHLAKLTELSPSQQNYLDKIDTSSHALLNIINNILDISKIEAGKLELYSDTFSLDKVLQQLADILEFKVKEKNLELVFSVDPKTPQLLVGDSQRLSQILLNLTHNAIKFSDSGKIIIMIQPLQLSCGAVTLLFSVQDSGLGIGRAQSKRLFRPFSQIDNSITRKYGGTGLGLAISKQLVELMGGKIWLKSKLGAGSIFYFQIPLEISPLTQLPESSTEFVPSAAGLAGRRVLLVEDSEIAREVGSLLLAQLKIQVEFAENGKQAVQRLAEDDDFDLVLMDIHMPIMDGLTATRLIRSDKRLQKVPIVAMTAKVLKGDRELCLAAGMNDYLTKPIDPNQLGKTLSFWINSPLRRPKKAESVEPESEQTTLRMDKDQLPAPLPPFDIAAALGNMNGDKVLLRKLILRFRHDYADAINDITELLSVDNFEAAERLVHTIKGSAMILKIDQLSNVAGLTEQAIAERNADKIRLMLKALAAVLNPALEAAAVLAGENDSVVATA